MLNLDNFRVKDQLVAYGDTVLVNPLNVGSGGCSSASFEARSITIFPNPNNPNDSDIYILTGGCCNGYVNHLSFSEEYGFYLLASFFLPMIPFGIMPVYELTNRHLNHRGGIAWGTKGIWFVSQYTALGSPMPIVRPQSPERDKVWFQYDAKKVLKSYPELVEKAQELTSYQLSTAATREMVEKGLIAETFRETTAAYEPCPD